MAYSRIIPIEFSHCDPAGIVFYPRFVEMSQRMVENYFIDVLDYPFSRMVAAGEGIPAARLEFNFLKPSRLGDRVEWVLTVEHIGRTSIRFLIRAEDRITARTTVVWISGDLQPTPILDHIRAKLEADHA